jgi:hypothetical protein
VTTEAGLAVTTEPGLAVAADGGAAASADRPPSPRTVIASDPKLATTVPSRSVRRTLAPDAASRSSVALAGWP